MNKKRAPSGKAALTAFALIMLTGCSMSPEARVVRNAVDALGGAGLINSVRTLVLEGQGEAYRLGQSASPKARPTPYQVTKYRQIIDFRNRRWREEMTGTEPFLAPSTHIVAVDNQVAFDLNDTGQATLQPDPISRYRQAKLYHHPIGILQAALNPANRIIGLGAVGGEERVDVVTTEGMELTLSIDSVSGLPSKVQSLAYHPTLGDVIVETGFGNYVDVDGLKLPTRLTSRLDRYLISSIAVSNRVNGNTGGLEATVDLKSQVASTPVATIRVENVGRGIWYLAGDSHHSVVVEFADHLTLIEAPQNDVRTLAVIETARQLNPNKPLIEVINTHHHFGHSGGIRAAISEGLTIITHEANRSFYEEIASHPHRLSPDALQNKPAPVSIRTINEPYSLSDATRTVVVYPLTGSPHADTLLMVYFPAERILTVADVYSPPPEGAEAGWRFPHVPNLLENIEKLNLRVDRVLPLHGGVVPFQDVIGAGEAEAGAASGDSDRQPAS